MVYLVESTQTEKGTDIITFSRNKSGEKKIERISTFLPYFYAPSSDPIPDDIRIIKTEDGFKAIDGTSVRKIFTKLSSDVPKVRERFSKHYEADIMFPHRYIIDKIGEIEPYPLNVVYVDIETDMDEDFPEPENPQYPISCLTVEDTFTNKKITLFYQSPKVEQKLKESETVKLFKTEEDMLGYFIKTIQEFDPDILTGWNGLEFDLSYLINRMKLLGIQYSKLSPMGIVRIDPKWKNVTIKGIITIDMLESYKHFRGISNQGRSESYSLDFVSEQILGEGKIEHEVDFHDLWVKFPEKLIEYNRKDVELIRRINEKIGLFDFFNSIRTKACSQFNSVPFESILIDGLLLNYAKDKVVLPSKPKNSMGESYKGAHVFIPEPGLYENVLALDIVGMYPNIIKTFNMSYETFDPNGPIHIYDGIGFIKTPGIIPIVMKTLETERNRYKDLRDKFKDSDEDKSKNYDHKQYGIKVLMNSFYGYLGYEKARLYKKEVANAITSMGRKLIYWTKSVLEKQSYIVLYVDTD